MSVNFDEQNYISRQFGVNVRRLKGREKRALNTAQGNIFDQVTTH